MEISSEVTIRDRLVGLGWKVYENGWPDLFCISPKGKRILVEAKGPYDKVKPNQRVMHDLLRESGFDVYVVRVRKRGLLRRKSKFWMLEEEFFTRVAEIY